MTWKFFTTIAEEEAERRYPESDITYGYGAVREAFEMGVWFAAQNKSGAILMPREEGWDER